MVKMWARRIVWLWKHNIYNIHCDILYQEKNLESWDTNGNYTTLNPSFANIIWMPDIFIGKQSTVGISGEWFTWSRLRSQIRVFIGFGFKKCMESRSGLNIQIQKNIVFFAILIDHSFNKVIFNTSTHTKKFLTFCWGCPYKSTQK